MTALAALVALREGVNGASAPRNGGSHDEPAGAVMVRGDLEHAARVLQALVTLEDIPAASLLRSALRDELELLRDRVLAGLSIRYGVDGLNRVAFQLAQSNLRFHALALEWLDVTLVGTDRAAVPLLEPGLPTSERLRVLGRWFPIPPTTPQAVLVELAEDRDGHWRRPWITACVLLTAADMPELGVEALAGADDHTRIVHETLVGIAERQTARHA